MKKFNFLILGLVLASPYLLKTWLRRLSTQGMETTEPLTGDNVVEHPRITYTLAISIAAPPSKIWPWLVQMGRGRAGFYTYTWVETLLGADIHNADEILPQFQNLQVGDKIWLTPNPYLGKIPGQFLVVDQIIPPKALVFRQQLPNGSTGSWAFILRPQNGRTRLIFRRRGSDPSVFDRIAEPGYLLMDWGMLRGIKKRATMK